MHLLIKHSTINCYPYISKRTAYFFLIFEIDEVWQLCTNKLSTVEIKKIKHQLEFMNDKNEDRSLFVLLVHVHFFRYQISDIEYHKILKREKTVLPRL